MDDNKIPLPEEGDAKPLAKKPTFLVKDEWFDVDVGADFLNFEEPYKPPRYTMERKGVPFADVGELHIISGKPGHGKTGLISQLMATVLCGRFGHTESREVAHKIADETGVVTEQVIDPKVLYIDTEQGKDDTIAIKNRVCSLAGLPFNRPLDCFKILRLRDTEEAVDRWRKILKAIYLVKPTDIFLDGLLDIVKDYNDQVECQPIIRKCMMLATEYDASMWAVLHENPLVDKLVGVLGSITQRKVAEIFTVVKIKQCNLKPNERRDDLPEIYFRVKQVKARGRDVEDWLFEYISDADGWGKPVELEDNGRQVTGDETKLKNFVNEANERFGRMHWTSSGLTRTDIDNALYSQGVTSNRARAELINIAIEYEILYKSGTAKRTKYHYNGLDKQMPNDTSEDLPFERPDADAPSDF